MAILKHYRCLDEIEKRRYDANEFYTLLCSYSMKTVQSEQLKPVKQ